MGAYYFSKRISWKFLVLVTCFAGRATQLRRDYDLEVNRVPHLVIQDTGRRVERLLSSLAALPPPLRAIGRGSGLSRK